MRPFLIILWLVSLLFSASSAFAASMNKQDICSAAIAQDPSRMSISMSYKFHRLAYPVFGIKALLAEIASGHPVVVLQNWGNSSAPLWKCVSVQGYESAKSLLTIHDDKGRLYKTSLALFMALWRDSGHKGFALLEPGALPEDADAERYLQATASMENAGLTWESVLAYDAALTQWPDNPKVLIGLNNALSAMGESRGIDLAAEINLPERHD